jgi:hypothetical protein
LAFSVSSVYDLMLSLETIFPYEFYDLPFSATEATASSEARLAKRPDGLPGSSFSFSKD